MTPGRRTLRYASFGDVMPDLEQLLEDHTTVGQWSLARIRRHLAAVIRRHVDLPASTPSDPSGWVSEERRRQMLESGILAGGIPTPPALMPDATLGEREEAEALRDAIGHYRASPGPAIPHRILGPLTRDEWDRFELIHLARHLSFAVPTAE